ncbi:SMP-30/gluconolactonase/LRE family protein, partial [Paraburkholderia sp. SIMBA_030]
MSASLNIAVPLTMSLGECPLWDHRHDRLHWIDIHAGRIYSWTPGDNVEPHIIELDEPVGSL